MSVRVLRALVRKDLRLFFADRRSVIIGFILPIALASFFGFLFGGASRPQRRVVKIALAMEDEGAAARRLHDALAADPSLALTTGDTAAAREAVARGKVALAIVIPPGFGASAEDKPELVLLVDPSRAAEAGMMQGSIARHVAGAVSGQPRPELPYRVRVEEVTASEDAAYNGYAHAFAGMGVQFMLMTSLEAGIAVLVQRQRGLWKRLRAAPLSRHLVLFSRALSGALISMMVLGVLFVFGMVVFGIRVEGSVAGFVLVCAASALMSSAFGLLVAALGKTPEATRGISIFVILVIVMLGGAWAPSFLFPPWLQQVAAVSPAKWAVDGLDAMLWRGLGLEAALAPVAALLGFAAIFGVLAALRFRWDE